MEMVLVPAGSYVMGSDLDVMAQPVHPVSVDSFWVDQFEVTNVLYAEFLNDQGNQVEDGVAWLELGAGHRGIVYGLSMKSVEFFHQRSIMKIIHLLKFHGMEQQTIVPGLLDVYLQKQSGSTQRGGLSPSFIPGEIPTMGAAPITAT